MIQGFRKEKKTNSIEISFRIFSLFFLEKNWINRRANGYFDDRLRATLEKSELWNNGGEDVRDSESFMDGLELFFGRDLKLFGIFPGNVFPITGYLQWRSNGIPIA